MYRRHEELPVYLRIEGVVDARHYNQVQLALSRLGGEPRLTLPGLRTLDLLLQKGAWIVVDRALGDLPVVAWSDFKVEGRSSLHLPVACRIRLFHANAELITKRVLSEMEQILKVRLEGASKERGILPFKRKGDD